MKFFSCLSGVKIACNAKSTCKIKNPCLFRPKNKKEFCKFKEPKEIRKRIVTTTPSRLRIKKSTSQT